AGGRGEIFTAVQNRPEAGRANGDGWLAGQAGQRDACFPQGSKEAAALVGLGSLGFRRDAERRFGHRRYGSSVAVGFRSSAISPLEVPSYRSWCRIALRRRKPGLPVPK